MIVKNYVALAMISTVDRLFHKVMPQAALDNRERLNKAKALRISKDNNSFRAIYGRATAPVDHLPFRAGLQERASLCARAAANVLVNVFVLATINFSRALNNYFAPIFVIMLQYFGYRQQAHIAHPY